MSIERILAAAASQPWAIQPEKLAEIAALLELRSTGAKFSAPEIAARVGPGRTGATAAAPSAVAVIGLVGVVTQRASMLNELSSGGSTSTERVGAQLRAAMADPAVKAVLLEVDSPGGTVYGVGELAAQIRAAGSQKPIVAQVNSLAASAAYWIASAASEVVCTPGGEVGSIGVYSLHDDISGMLEKSGVRKTFVSAGAYKTEGHPYGPLTDEARAYTQKRVDEVYGDFIGAVARGRGVSVTRVRDEFGQGRVVGAREALKLGMVDRIGTMPETVRRLSTALPAVRGPSASSAFAGSPQDQLRAERQIFRMVTSDDPAIRLAGQRMKLELQNR